MRHGEHATGFSPPDVELYNEGMTRDQVIQRIGGHAREIADLFGVRSLSLFGSAARDEMREGSDVDLLVAFRTRATFRGYFALKAYLERLLGCDVDLATEKMLKRKIRPLIEQELVRVA